MIEQPRRDHRAGIAEPGRGVRATGLDEVAGGVELVLVAAGLALSCSGTYAEQQKLCPKRRGGASDGELPATTQLSEIRRRHPL